MSEDAEKNEDSEPEFSFLMCVNKGHEFLDMAIKSVLDQTEKEFKFYIIANNCSDELWEHLNSYGDQRLVLHRTLIGQLAFNLNYGLNLIGNGYVLRMDSDDISMPDRLKITKTRLSEFGYPDILGGRAILIDSKGQKIGEACPPMSDEEIRAKLWKKNPIIHPSCALKVKSIIKLRGYLGGFMSEDYDLWLRAARSPDMKFKNIEDILIEYRINPYQSRGDALAYSEVAGHMVREALLGGRFISWVGFIVAAVKRYARDRG